MIDVQPGQWVLIESPGGYWRTARADKVTPKQIRTRSWGSRYSQEDRERVCFAGTEERANEMQRHCSTILDSRRAEERKIREAFEEEVAPAVERRDNAKAELVKEYRKGILALLDNAKGGGEVSAQSEGIN